MSYCPEDAAKMKPAGMGVSHACYDCPACNTHWCYDPELIPHLGYLLFQNREECPYAAWHEGEKSSPRQ